MDALGNRQEAREAQGSGNLTCIQFISSQCVKARDLTSMGLLLTTTNMMLLVCVALRMPKSKRLSFTLGGKTSGWEKNMFSYSHFISCLLKYTYELQPFYHLVF